MADIISPDNEIWTKSLKNIPRFSSVTIAKHLEKCGKSCAGEKGYKFFIENYIHDVLVRENKRQSLYVIKGRCHRSQRKNEAPHTDVRVKLGMCLLFSYYINILKCETSCDTIVSI